MPHSCDDAWWINEQAEQDLISRAHRLQIYLLENKAIVSLIFSPGDGKKIFAATAVLTRTYKPTTLETTALIPQASEEKPVFHHKVCSGEIYIFFYLE